MTNNVNCIEKLFSEISWEIHSKQGFGLKFYVSCAHVLKAPSTEIDFFYQQMGAKSDHNTINQFSYSNPPSHSKKRLR